LFSCDHYTGFAKKNMGILVGVVGRYWELADVRRLVPCCHLRRLGLPRPGQPCAWADLDVPANDQYTFILTNNYPDVVFSMVKGRHRRHCVTHLQCSISPGLWQHIRASRTHIKYVYIVRFLQVQFSTSSPTICMEKYGTLTDWYELLSQLARLPAWTYKANILSLTHSERHFYTIFLNSWPLCNPLLHWKVRVSSVTASQPSRPVYR
jgi:hypothetical protein